MLDEPLRYTDRVVGLSMNRQDRRDGETLIGMTRIYAADGLLLRYVLRSSDVAEGEALPDSMLADLLPADLLRGQRVVVHADGRLRKEVLRALGGWEDEIEAMLYPVSVTRRGVPHVYALQGGTIMPPPQGTLFRLSDSEALVTTQTSEKAVCRRCTFAVRPRSASMMPSIQCWPSRCCTTARCDRRGCRSRCTMRTCWRRRCCAASLNHR
ncbi:MAG: hypothetical protein HC828_18720 [Blastochloris sp.]|nr:hypothetical protein [Blastochloris sp.]